MLTPEKSVGFVENTFLPVFHGVIKPIWSLYLKCKISSVFIVEGTVERQGGLDVSVCWELPDWPLES